MIKPKFPPRAKLSRAHIRHYIRCFGVLVSIGVRHVGWLSKILFPPLAFSILYFLLEINKRSDVLEKE